MSSSFSLRSKLFGLGILCVAMAAVPLIFLAGRDFQENSRERERAAFANIVMLLEENISTLYNSLMSTFTESMVEGQKDLGRLAHLTRDSWLHAKDRNVEQTFNLWSQSLRQLGFYLTIFKDGKALYGDISGAASINQARTAFTGETLNDLLKADTRQETLKSAFFNLTPEEWRRFDPLYPDINEDLSRHAQNVTVLLTLLTVPEKKSVIAMGMPMKSLDAFMRNSEYEIAKKIQVKFNSTRLSAGGGLALFDDQGNTLACKGPQEIFAGITDDSHINSITKRLEQEKSVEVIAASTPDGKAVLYRVARFAPLKWYIAAGIPIEEVEAPTTRLMSHLAMLASITTVAALLITLTLAAALIRPLRELTLKANALAEADLSLPGAVLKAINGIASGNEAHKGQKDEVRQLAQALSRLGSTLDRKISELMSATSAKERMQGELAAAREIQLGMLPSPDALARPQNFEMNAFLAPAREVGGDFYDFMVMPDKRIVLIIGDVSDKGVPAALFMAVAVTLLRRCLREGKSPAKAMASLSDALAENNPNTMFLTLFIGVFNPQNGELHYANGAHCPPHTVDKSGSVRVLEQTSGPLLGALPGMRYAQHRVTLNPGETCLLFTDGVSEAMNPAGELYGEKRLKLCLKKNKGKNAAELIKAVHDSVTEFSGKAPQSDDIAMLAFSRWR